MVEGTSGLDPHRPIMAAEVVAHLRPRPGDVVVDCTLGGGGHARALLPHVLPGGRLIGLDVDPVELPRAGARLRACGFDAESFALQHANFRDVRHVLSRLGVDAADAVLVDLGVSSMQHDKPERGFSYKHPGPLDLRMDPTSGAPGWQRLAALDRAAIAVMLATNADEPHADLIAQWLAIERPQTTHALERLVRTGLSKARPELPKAEVKMSVRRTFQAIRIMVNDEFAALDALLDALPSCLKPGGRAVFLTFHSGEDRRVKKSLQAGRRQRLYSVIADQVVRSTKAETFSNRRAASAKLRWAVRSSA